MPLTTSALKIVDKEGKESTAQLTAGVTYFRRAGVEHNVTNASGGDFASSRWSSNGSMQTTTSLAVPGRPA